MINILIPMAGSGQRFKDAGYNLPKPLIEVYGKPLIQRVVESLKLPGRYIFGVLREHHDEFRIGNIIHNLCTDKKIDYQIIWVNSKTEGAVNTCLLASSKINTYDPLVIANSDQIVNFDRELFLGKTVYHDGCLLTFTDNDPKWSYVGIKDGFVNQVKEKVPISTNANVGVYGWRHGCDFVSSAKELIRQNIRTNGEFYIAETYNILIEQGKKITNLNTLEMLGCGVPQDLEHSAKVIEYRERGVKFI